MSKTPFSLLTEDEKNAFIDYINAHAEAPTSCSAEYLLREWNAQKAHIFELFGEQLILKTDVEFSQSNDAIALDISQDWRQMPENAYRFTESLWGFLTKQKSKVWEEYHNRPFKDPEVYTRFEYEKMHPWYQVENLLSSETLAKNAVGEEFTIPMPKPDGSVREYRVQEGTKPLRVLRQLIKSYGEEAVGSMDDFNAFCVWHSQYLNTSSIKGKLCFSIHPLDYLTMSDNANDWTSCMSWQDTGCYRSGTVEMMNSPYAIVVYLEASDRKYYMTPNFAWNSKKWRTLCLITDPGVISVKSYPYYHKDITLFVVNYLTNLDKENNYIAPVSIHPYSDELINKAEIRIQPYTFRMYNDFSTTTHFIALKEKYNDGKRHVFTFNYSGKSECMSCGELYTADDRQMFSCEEQLSCMKCAGLNGDYVFCDSCGEIIHVDDACWIDDTPYCDECFDQVGFMDPFTDENHYLDDGTDTVFTFGTHRIELGSIYLPDFVHLNVREKYKNNILNQADKEYTTIDVSMLNDRGISDMIWFLRDRAYIDCAEELEKIEETKKVGQTPLPYSEVLEKIRFPNPQFIEKMANLIF